MALAHFLSAPVTSAPARLELFPYHDPLTGKWVRARYVAERHVIAARYTESEIIGPPEIREWREDARYFNPLRVEGSAPAVPIDNLGPIIELAGMVLRPRLLLAIVGAAS